MRTAASIKPVKWLVKRWIPANSLVMVHGESGAGKTFVVLDMIMRVAGKQSEWVGEYAEERAEAAAEKFNTSLAGKTS